MKRQRNTAQMKEQNSNTEVQINEEEIEKLPENNSSLPTRTQAQGMPYMKLTQTTGPNL